MWFSVTEIGRRAADKRDFRWPTAVWNRRPWPSLPTEPCSFSVNVNPPLRRDFNPAEQGRGHSLPYLKKSNETIEVGDPG